MVPPNVTRHTIRDIRSARRHRPAADTRVSDTKMIDKVVDLRAWSGRNVIRFPRTGGPTSAA
ncbi:hypothetical protein Misp01_31090 [Microtetraspora sp. NBRC 13810]|nr:hypothetical protein Misp01_31090 [Microtetraspora sp. NBRC 13810]